MAFATTYRLQKPNKRANKGAGRKNAGAGRCSVFRPPQRAVVPPGGFHRSRVKDVAQVDHRGPCQPFADGVEVGADKLGQCVTRLCVRAIRRSSAEAA